ncbi:FCD domain-containing protein [Rubellimicrobium aerolatum]|uniref:FCD domain-containing protein n=1 Tax=Rubellimicrobium aerolatum TaxID=490979 RepID=A0ABW0SFY0_9RHOB|nr:FCD domain-containing protein [Rubellimicrobium aerolatum]MBP1807243.1 DNA-binding FadR family transcriptional regulator [Rubellimicrobium aerolatum]
MTDAAALRPDTRAADAVVRELEARIASGALPDGAHLPPERDLIDTYGVSRTVVREAVARLASRGLVESRPRHRPVVRRPGVDAALAAAGGVVGHLLRESGGVKNLYDTRILLEGALVRHAALQARKADVAALARALAENEAAIPDSDRFYATDVAFHAVLYEIPRNPILPAVHKAFTAWLAEHWRKMPRSPERNRVNFLRHRDILLAIQDRDPDAAEAALASHLNAAWEYVRGTFEGP